MNGRLLLTGALASRRQKAFRLRGEFSTNRAAGAVNGTLAEPTGGARSVVDTNSKFSISSGVLSIATGGAANDNIHWPAITTSPGRVLAAVLNGTNSNYSFGWDSDNVGLVSANINFGSATLLRIRGATLVGVPPASGTNVYVATVLRSAGLFYFIKETTAFPVWSLLWMDTNALQTAMYPGLSTGATTSVVTLDQVRVPTRTFIPVPLQSDGFSAASTDGAGNSENNGPVGQAWTNAAGTWGVSAGKAQASALASSKAFRTLPTASPDVIADVAVTRSAGVGGLVLRYQDASNYLIAYHDGTNAKLDKVVAGVTTNVISAAATYSAGAILRVIMAGTAIRLYYNGAAVGTVQTVTDMAAATTHGLYTTDTGNTFDNFVAWARGTEGQYAALNGFFNQTVTQGIMPMGDSKTNDSTDWPGPFYAYLYNAGGYWWRESPTRYAVAGWKTADLRAHVEANLAAESGLGNYVLINIGANDLSGGTMDETTWKADMTAILNAIHAWRPACQVYIMRPWRRGYMTQANTLAGWIASVVALFDFAHLGPDERVFLENGDDGATYTSDGTHPTMGLTPGTGAYLEAQEWRTVLGF